MLFDAVDQADDLRRILSRAVAVRVFKRIGSTLDGMST